MSCHSWCNRDSSSGEAIIETSRSPPQVKPVALPLVEVGTGCVRSVAIVADIVLVSVMLEFDDCVAGSGISYELVWLPVDRCVGWVVRKGAVVPGGSTDVEDDTAVLGNAAAVGGDCN